MALLAACGTLAFSAQAEQPVDAFAWLERIASAAQKLNYAGTFTYQRGSHSETSRIVHHFDGRIERERLEVLDGSPRELVRVDDEVRCYLPVERTVIIQHQARRAFPALPREAMDRVARHYRVRVGTVDRVAGRDALVLLMEPRDQMRFGYRLWAERASGLLLKLRTVDEKGGTVEQFGFTEVQLGVPVAAEALASRFADKTASWHVYNTRTVEGIGADDPWTFRFLPPGFVRSAGVRLRLREDNREAMHYVFTDGMAAISVFIERAARGTEPPHQGFDRSGGVQAYQRVLADSLVTVVGEVPGRTLKGVADGVAPR
ncbi:MAG: MucB/RseB C-terminal domain-containing protein [Rhodocyclaceae bacterium]